MFNLNKGLCWYCDMTKEKELAKWSNVWRLLANWNVLTLQEGICFNCTFAETSLLYRGWHGFSFSYSNQTVTFLLLICPSGLLDHNIAFFTTRSHHKITLIRSLKFECLPSLFVCLAVTRFWHVVFPFACITNASYPLFSN